jgi:hypothetical protein
MNSVTTGVLIRHQGAQSLLIAKFGISFANQCAENARDNKGRNSSK